MAPTRYVGDGGGPGKGFRRALTLFSYPADLQGSLEEVWGQKGDRHPDIRGEAALSPVLVIPPSAAPWSLSLGFPLFQMGFTGIAVGAAMVCTFAFLYLQFLKLNRFYVKKHISCFYVKNPHFNTFNRQG